MQRQVPYLWETLSFIDFRLVVRSTNLHIAQIKDHPVRPLPLLFKEYSWSCNAGAPRLSLLLPS